MTNFHYEVNVMFSAVCHKKKRYSRLGPVLHESVVSVKHLSLLTLINSIMIIKTLFKTSVLLSSSIKEKNVAPN